MIANNAESDVFAVVCEFLSTATSAPPGLVLNADTPLLEGGALDSLGILQLTARLEEVFGFQVADEDFTPENFETIGTLSRYISGRLTVAA
jgi:acyl carrier protein